MTIPAHAGPTRGTSGSSGPADSSPQGPGSITALIDAAARRSDLSDRAVRVYTVAALSFTGAFDMGRIESAVGGLSHKQLGQALGELVNAGLLTRKVKVVGYNGDRPVRRTIYRLVVAL